MSPSPIDLVRGWPAASLLPISLLQRATSRALVDRDVAYAALNYGPDAGHDPLRRALATWLTTFYQPQSGAISYRRIAITGGASQNLGNILNVYTDPEYTRKIWIVAPAYFLSFRIFEDAGFGNFGVRKKMAAIPEDDEGPDVEYLRRRIIEIEKMARHGSDDKPLTKAPRSWGKIYKHVIYCVPTFANPSSRTTSLKRRQDLVRCAREFDALVVCDDVYDFLSFPTDGNNNEETRGGMDRATLPRLVDLDRAMDGGPDRAGADAFGNVVSNGSFSKIGAPGLRCGWIEATEKFAFGIAETGTTKSGGAPSQFVSTLMADLLEAGELQSRVLTVLQPSYAKRFAKMVSAIEAHLLPLGVTMPQSERQVAGGYFIWITLPKPLQSAEVAQRAEADQNLRVAPGDMFQVPGDESEANRFQRQIRLCFSNQDEEELVQGVVKLGKVVHDMLKQSSQKGSATPNGG
ncbi:MAG: hypothetical protein M1822_009390 [Bathelium mastoideum]|nr:MAG: hypothetical protein M1822_009390 [Bathelium mastoideum]